MDRKKKILLIVLILVKCNILNRIDKGVSPLVKFFSFTNTEQTALAAISVLPKDNSAGNYLNTNVFVVFNKSISGFTSDSFTLSSDGGTSKHPGNVTITDKVLEFSPSQNFTANANYKGTVKASNGLAKEFTFTIGMGTAVDNTAPFVANTNPAAGDVNMPVNVSIAVTFSEVIDPSSISTSSFSVTGVTGTVLLAEQTLTFIPSSDLPSNTTLTVLIKSGIKDLAGNIVNSPYSWTFTTGSVKASSCTLDVSLFNICLFN